MGAAATATKARVLDTAERCLSATNQAIGDVDALKALHNAFVEKVEQDLTRVDQHLALLSGDVADVAAHVTRVDRRELAHYDLWHDFVALTFTERLRWLLTGRLPTDRLGASARGRLMEHTR